MTEICRRLDGIALAIELAAARMVSMSPGEVLDRLADRFRLLRGTWRGLERHQTLRNAVAWSYDLLVDDEQKVLGRCSVFAGGFDLTTAVTVCGGGELDEYAVLDVLDSLVRKSLLTTEHVSGRTRYGLLETIRQFAEERLAATGTIGEVRDRHARLFSGQAVAHWEIWDGPQNRVATEWMEIEFANLRAGFRWAVDQGDLDTATAIAAHTTMLAQSQLRGLEPEGWAEEILPAATAADVVELPKLYVAASYCSQLGRVEAGVSYAETAVALETDARYDSFAPGWASGSVAVAYLFAGRVDRGLEICTDVANQPGLAHVRGLCLLTFVLPALGRAEEAMAIAEETVAAARGHGNPFWIAYALGGFGRAFTRADPSLAMMTLREALLYTRVHRLSFLETVIARDLAGLEAVHGDPDRALALLDTAIDSFHRAGDLTYTVATVADTALCFDHLERPEIAATLYGACSRLAAADFRFVNLADTVEHLRSALATTVFQEHATAGAAMELGDAVAYAREQIRIARSELRAGS